MNKELFSLPFLISVFLILNVEAFAGKRRLTQSQKKDPIGSCHRLCLEEGLNKQQRFLSTQAVQKEPLSDLFISTSHVMTVQEYLKISWGLRQFDDQVLSYQTEYSYSLTFGKETAHPIETILRYNVPYIEWTCPRIVSDMKPIIGFIETLVLASASDYTHLHIKILDEKPDIQTPSLYDQCFGKNFSFHADMKSLAHIMEQRGYMAIPRYDIYQGSIMYTFEKNGTIPFL